MKPSVERSYEAGIVCPAVGVPIGTGILLAGGNSNLYQGNWIWDNWRFGAMQFWVPASVRGETDPDKEFDTSHFNRYVGNHMGIAPGGTTRRNGTDVWWDEGGVGNCWQDNVAGSGPVTSDPPNLPDCAGPSESLFPNFDKWFAAILPCSTWSPENPDPPGCNWTQKPPRPE